MLGKRMKKPNIMIIQTESHDGRVLGCLGHSAMKEATPSLDRLAAEGTVFENHYCNYPLWVPGVRQIIDRKI